MYKPVYDVKHEKKPLKIIFSEELLSSLQSQNQKK